MGLDCGICPPRTVRLRPTGDQRCVDDPILTEGSLTWKPVGDFDSEPHRRDGNFAIRLGLHSVRTISPELAQRIIDNRAEHGRFADMTDVVRRVGLTTPQMEALATAGAFRSFNLDRRQALWQAGPASTERPDQLEESGSPLAAPQLPVMSDGETSMADLWATGITTQDHPIQYVRESLDKRGAVPAAMLAKLPTGRRILVGGVVTHRQRPATAAGVTFMNLEDETGMVNVVIPVPVWNKFLRVARESSALVIRGLLETQDGAINLVAEHLETLPISIASMAPTAGLPRMSRDFR